MKIENILKVGDISTRQLQKETVDWLQQNGEITYKDQVLKEDIYNIEGTIEGINNEEIDCPKEVFAELEAIGEKLQKKDCGYLRITY